MATQMDQLLQGLSALTQQNAAAAAAAAQTNQLFQQALTAMQTSFQQQQAAATPLTPPTVIAKDDKVGACMGKQEPFDGSKSRWTEWSIKTALVYEDLTKGEGTEALEWAQQQDKSITGKDLDDACLANGWDVGKTRDAAQKLRRLIVTNLVGDVFHMLTNVTCGFEAWRALHAKYSPRTPGTKRQLLMRLIGLGTKPAKNPLQTEAKIVEIDNLVKQYDAAARATRGSSQLLQDDIKVAVLMSILPDGTRNYLDFTNNAGGAQNQEYAELRENVLAWAQRSRTTLEERDPKALSKMEKDDPMDTSSVERDEATNKIKKENQELRQQIASMEHFSWDSYGWDSWDDDEHQVPLDAIGKGRKGFGGKGSGGKGFGSKGFGKQGKAAGHAGKGSGKMGKGLPAQFYGYCHSCGIWGHSAKYCRKGSQTNNLEENAEDCKQTHELGALEEVRGERHLIGSVEVKPTQRDSDRSGQKKISTRNMWAALADEERADKCSIEYSSDVSSVSSIEYSSDVSSVSGTSIFEKQDRERFPVLQHRIGEKAKTSNMPKARSKLNVLELNNLELNAMNQKRKSKLVVTIDSGAAESVINGEEAPHVPTLPSPGSLSGVEYVNANGSTMPNRGQKVVPVRLGDGSACDLKMQVTDVKRTLLSVGKVCDAGHRVVFEATGGYMEHIGSGKKFAFDRVRGVYRMEVDVENPASGFTRPE